MPATAALSALLVAAAVTLVRGVDGHAQAVHGYPVPVSEKHRNITFGATAWGGVRPAPPCSLAHTPITCRHQRHRVPRRGHCDGCGCVHRFGWAAWGRDLRGDLRWSQRVQYCCDRPGCRAEPMRRLQDLAQRRRRRMENRLRPRLSGLECELSVLVLPPVALLFIWAAVRRYRGTVPPPSPVSPLVSAGRSVLPWCYRRSTLMSRLGSC